MKTQEQIKKNGIGQSIVHLLDALNMGVILGFFLNPAWTVAALPFASYFLFPAAAALSIANAVLAFNEARLNGWKNKRVNMKAFMATLSAILITLAVVGSFTIPGFALVTPILFTVTMGSNLFYNVGSSAFYAGKDAMETELDGVQKQKNNRITPKQRSNASPTQQKTPAKNFGLMKNHIIGSIMGALFLAPIIGIFLLNPAGIAIAASTVTILAAIGVAAAIVVAGLAIYGLVNQARDISKPEVTKADTAKLVTEKTLSESPENNPNQNPVIMKSEAQNIPENTQAHNRKNTHGTSPLLSVSNGKPKQADRNPLLKENSSAGKQRNITSNLTSSKESFWGNSTQSKSAPTNHETLFEFKHQ